MENRAKDLERIFVIMDKKKPQDTTSKEHHKDEHVHEHVHALRAGHQPQYGQQGAAEWVAGGRYHNPYHNSAPQADWGGRGPRYQHQGAQYHQPCYPPKQQQYDDRPRHWVPPAHQHQEMCWRCGKPHDPNNCSAVNYHCRGCGKKGHIISMCYHVRQPQQQQQHKHVSRKPHYNKKGRVFHTCHHETEHEVSSSEFPETSDEESECKPCYMLGCLGKDRAKIFDLKVSLNNTDVTMYLDTGSDNSVIPASLKDK